MDILEAFKQHLFTSKNKPSKVTVKNYAADIRKFISWYEKFYQRNFFPSDVNQVSITAYKNALLSATTATGEGTSAFRSYKRYLASLKKFTDFLQSEGIIQVNLFPQEQKPAVVPDPWLLRGFKNSLSSNKLSNHSIKNYLNDLNQFIHWYKAVKGIKEITAGENILSGLNSAILEEYKQRLSFEANYSPVSVNRKLSSLRKYLSWLSENKLINNVLSFGNLPQIRQPEIVKESTEKLSEIEELKEIVQYNHEDKIPQIKARSRFGPIRFVAGVGSFINLGIDLLITNPLTALASAGNYGLWTLKGKVVFQPVKKIFHEKISPDISTGLSSSSRETPTSTNTTQTAKTFNRWEAFVLNRKTNTIKAPHNIAKSFYAPLDVSATDLPWHKKLLLRIRFNRPNWYKKYHTYPIVHYIHFALVFVFAAVVGVNMYHVFFNDSLRQNPILADMTAAPPRTLAFQGKLTDALNTPITAETPLRFGMYNDAIATGSALVWQEVQNVTPDQNGNFSVMLGRRNPIGQKVFSDNPNLYIGITIGVKDELHPRQQLATTNYAANAIALQGLKPITQVNAGTNNVILALDSTGNLTIGGSAHPTFEASGGEFTLSGQVLTLATNPDSNTNVQIRPDGTGIIDLQKPIQNTTNYSNIPGIQGAVEVDDSLAILATSSGQSAFIINQNGIGALISASTSGLAKFTVDNLGTGMFAGDVAINGNNLTTKATSFNLLNNNAINITIGNSASSISIASSSGTTTINNSLVVSKLATFAGGVLIPAGQTLNFNGSISSHLMPLTDSLYDLGSPTNHWNNAYFTHLVVGGNTSESADPVATFSANTTNSAVTINNNGSGDLLSVAAHNVNKFVISQNGSIGVGNPLPAFKLDLQDSQSATAAAQIYNTDTGSDADGLIVKLGNTSASTVSTTNHFINFETAGIGVVGSIQGNGSKGISYVQNGLADFAEYMKKDARQDIAYGSLVCINQDGKVIPCDANNTSIVGVTSEHPAFLGGENLGSGSIAVGLTGLVRTNVTTSHGDIKPGDVITLSNIPGIGAKATQPGMIVGRALESYTSSDDHTVGSVLVSIHISWFDPQNQLTSSGNVQDPIALNPGDVVVKPLALDAKTTTIDGKQLKEYIADSVSDTLTTNTLYVDTIAPLTTDTKISLKLGSNELAILSSQFATSSAVARFDNQGNAHLNGKLTANGIQTNDATISGTLHAKNIIADSIDGLDQKLATLAASLNRHESNTTTNDNNSHTNKSLDNTIEVASSSSELDATQSAMQGSPLAVSPAPTGTPYNSTNPFTMTSSLINTFADMASISGQLATVANLKTDVAMVNKNLMVFGSSSLSDVSVTGQLSIGGGFILTQNSMNTIGSDLELQSLRQGDLSIMAGLVKIDTNGNLSVSGNATFAKDVTVRGTLAAGVISPVDNSDLVVKLNGDKKTNQKSSNLVIQNASGSGVMAINQLGDLITSGTGAFSQLAAQGLHIIRGVQADTSMTETTASSSAGKAVIAAQQTHRTIFTPYVKANSLIYITATSNTEGVTPYVSRQNPEDETTHSRGSFTIEIPTTINQNLTLNWWIVN